MSTRKKQWINCGGLAIGALGASILVYFGMPQPNFEKGESLGLEPGTVIDDKGTTVAQRDAAREKESACYKCRAQIGFSLMVAGFVMQLVGSWPDRVRAKVDAAN